MKTEITRRRFCKMLGVVPFAGILSHILPLTSQATQMVVIDFQNNFIPIDFPHLVPDYHINMSKLIRSY